MLPLCKDDQGQSLKHIQNKMMFYTVCEIAATFLCGTLLPQTKKLGWFLLVFQMLMWGSLLMMDSQ